MSQLLSQVNAENWTFVHPKKYWGRAILVRNHAFLQATVIGFTLNVCCGFSTAGHVLLDLDEKVLQHHRRSTLNHPMLIRGDVRSLPFREGVFETIICDPPFSYYGKFRWVFNILRLASKRVILSVPSINIQLPKGWTKELYWINTNHIFIRLWFIFTKAEASGSM